MQPFLAQIMIVSFNFAPRNWALCNGQLLPINQNQALFSLLGVMYGGNGQVNFALPNLQGRIPNGAGGTFAQGQTGGEASVTLSMSQIPTHNHIWGASNATATDPKAEGTVLAGANMYTSAPVDSSMLPSAVS